MSLTLGAATKLLDNMMTNYSEWHTERAPQGKKVNFVEETSSLSDKIDMLASLLTKQVPMDPNNVALNSLLANENDQVDVNFLLETISITMLIKIILVVTTIDRKSVV